MGRVSVAPRRHLGRPDIATLKQESGALARRLAEPEVWLPFGALALAFLALLGVARVPVFVDEADNVLGSCLIDHGTLLYRDFFSHHFPLPYYALAVLSEPASCSVFAGRLIGIVSLTLAGAAFARIAQNPAATFALLILALTAPLYYLQLYLAETMLAVGLILTLAFLTDHGRRMLDPVSHGLRFVALSILAWSSPIGLMIAAILVPLMIVGTGRPYRSVIAASAAALLVWPALLALQGTLGAFFEQAVLFNTQVYSQFLDVQLTNPLSLLWHSLTFVRHRYSFAVDWMATQDADASAASYAAGFEMLLVLLLAILVIRARKETLFRLGVCLLVPLTVAREGFHLAPFIAAATFACAQLVPVAAGRSTLIRGIVIAMAVIAVRIYFFYLPIQQDAPDELAESMQPESRIVRSLGPDDTMLYLPIAPQGYLAHDRRPGSFYTYFLPWQADVPGAEDRLIADIEQNQVAVIVIDPDAEIWDKYRLTDYAPRLMAHIMGTYRPLDGGDKHKARIFVRNAPGS
jgi:hypothetical protein